MVKVQIKFDKRKFEREMRKGLEKAVVKHVAKLRCPEHGQPAKIVPAASTSGDLRLKVSGCCEKHIAEVKAKLCR